MDSEPVSSPTSPEAYKTEPVMELQKLILLLRAFSPLLMTRESALRTNELIISDIEKKLTQIRTTP